MINVLLIWEEVPENIKIYILEVNDEIYEKLVKCHGLYINNGLEDYELVEWLSNYITDKFAIYIGDDGEKIPFNLIGQYKVIVTGFIM